MTDIINVGFQIDPSGLATGAAEGGAALDVLEKKIDTLGIVVTGLTNNFKQFNASDLANVSSQLAAVGTEAESAASAMQGHTAATQEDLAATTALGDEYDVMASTFAQINAETVASETEMRRIVATAHEQVAAFHEGSLASDQLALSLAVLREETVKTGGEAMGAEFDHLWNATELVDAAIEQVSTDVKKATIDFEAGTLSAEGYATALDMARQRAGELSQGTDLSTKQMNTLQGAIGKTATTAPVAVAHLGRLRYGLMSMATQAVGASSGVAQVTSGVLMLGLTAMQTLGITVALAAIAIGYQKITEKQREQKKQLEELMATEHKHAQERADVNDPAGQFRVNIEMADKGRQEAIAKIRELQQTLESLKASSMAGAGASMISSITHDIDTSTETLRKYNALWRDLSASMDEALRKSVVGQAEMDAATVGMSPTNAAVERARRQGLSEEQLGKLRTALDHVEGFNNSLAIKALDVEVASLGKTEAEAARLALTLERNLSPALRAARLSAIDAREAFGQNQLVGGLREAYQATLASAEVTELFQLRLKHLTPELEAEAEGYIKAKYARQRDNESRVEAMQRTAEHTAALKTLTDAVYDGSIAIESDVEARGRALHLTVAETDSLKEQFRVRQQMTGGGHPGIADDPSLHQNSERKIKEAEVWHDAWVGAIVDTGDLMLGFLSNTRDQGLSIMQQLAKGIAEIINNIARQLLAAGLTKMLAGSFGGIPQGGDFPGFDPNSLPAPLSTTAQFAGAASSMSPQASRGGANITYHETSHYTIQALDASGVEDILQRHAGTIAAIPVKAARQSRAYQRALLGGR